jgi:hypothetical protein
MSGQCIYFLFFPAYLNFFCAARYGREVSARAIKRAEQRAIGGDALIARQRELIANLLV